MGFTEILDVINLVGIFGAVAVSAITLSSTKKLQTMQQQVTVMTHKRSKRIDDVRSFSSDIVALSKTISTGITVSEKEDKVNLVKAVCGLTSQLQYIYNHDIELIDTAKWLENALCFAPNPPSVETVGKMIDKFWILSDLYVGTEHERLKLEVGGNFQQTGETEKEANSFEAIYQMLVADLPKDKKALIEYIPPEL